MGKWKVFENDKNAGDWYYITTVDDNAGKENIIDMLYNMKLLTADNDYRFEEMEDEVATIVTDANSGEPLFRVELTITNFINLNLVVEVTDEQANGAKYLFGVEHDFSTSSTKEWEVLKTELRKRVDQCCYPGIKAEIVLIVLGNESREAI